MMPNEQEAAGMARDLISALQFTRRGDDETAAELLHQPGREGAMLGMAAGFILRALEDGGLDAGQWLQARLEEFREP